MKQFLSAALVVLLVVLASAPLVCQPLAGQEIPAGTFAGDDLEQIRARGVLRLITRNTPNTYFLYRGEQMGFEYELAEGFASWLGVDLEVVVVPEEADPARWLHTAQGDLIGASLVAFEAHRPGVVYSQPYKHVSRAVVVRKGETSIRQPEDLLGRKVWVAEGSRHYWWLRTLELQLGGLIDIECVPADTPSELILADVSMGTISAAIADTDVASLAMSFHGNLEVACTLGPHQPVSWGLRCDSADLLAAADEFLEDIQGSFFFNHLSRRYYDSGDEYGRFREAVFVAWKSGRLSRFDDPIQRHAATHGMDWLLITALAYKESSFNPAATSSAGARGLLQIMPKTASALGVADPHDPDENILAGIRYLRDQYELFENAATTRDQLSLALASYNAGIGHVRDAQKLAAEEGLDSSSWDSVAQVLSQLSRREYYEKTQYGYCRGKRAVRYVEEVLRHWEIYSDYLRDDAAIEPPAVAVEDTEPPSECLSALSASQDPSDA